MIVYVYVCNCRDLALARAKTEEETAAAVNIRRLIEEVYERSSFWPPHSLLHQLPFVPPQDRENAARARFKAANLALIEIYERERALGKLLKWTDEEILEGLLSSPVSVGEDGDKPAALEALLDITRISKKQKAVRNDFRFECVLVDCLSTSHGHLCFNALSTFGLRFPLTSLPACVCVWRRS